LTWSPDTNFALYPRIFKKMPFGIMILQLGDPRDINTFKVIELNPAAVRIIDSNLTDLRGRSLSEFPMLLASLLAAQCQHAFPTRKSRAIREIFYPGERFRKGIYSLEVFPLRRDFMGVFFHDATYIWQAEGIRRENGAPFRSLAGSVQAYALFQLDPGGHVISWNAGAERLKGYEAGEIIGQYLSVFYPKEDVIQGRPERLLEEARHFGRCEHEGWSIRKDGSRFWANVVITALRDGQGGVRGFVKLTRDKTERRERENNLVKDKQVLEVCVEQRTAALAQANRELRAEIAERQHAEEELKSSLDQLRTLATHLQTVREEERAWAARELHDELGQACTAIKLDLALLNRKLTARQAGLRSRVASAIELVDEMVVALRRIASTLRPRTLDDLGLTAALESQAREFEGRSGIACRLTLPQDPLDLNAESSTAIFRIFQESLTNVLRHAHATTVEALLEQGPTEIVLQVRDNGKGFDHEKIKAGKSLGLVGMQERALLLNGELKIHSMPDAGTTVTVRIPLAVQASPGISPDESSDC
jgi:PAS domain S-box-containing protein